MNARDFSAGLDRALCRVALRIDQAETRVHLAAGWPAKPAEGLPATLALDVAQEIDRICWEARQ